MTRFYLGTHHPGWLWKPEVTFPLFVSARWLREYRNLRPATRAWALDSGGFTELAKYGKWETSADQYAAEVARWQRQIGSLDWAAPQDWMCEPSMIARTGLSVIDHQLRTIENFQYLTGIWAEHSDRPCPFIPVLQGWTIADYIRCATWYAGAGIALSSYPLVGLGSVCRRQKTGEIDAIVAAFSALPLHGFGVKTLGLRSYGHRLASCDSLAWSRDARWSPPMPGHPHAHCANCVTYAAAWRERTLRRLDACGAQLSLWDVS